MKLKKLSPIALLAVLFCVSCKVIDVGDILKDVKTADKKAAPKEKPIVYDNIDIEDIEEAEKVISDDTENTIKLVEQAKLRASASKNIFEKINANYQYDAPALELDEWLEFYNDSREFSAIFTNPETLDMVRSKQKMKIATETIIQEAKKGEINNQAVIIVKEENEELKRQIESGSIETMKTVAIWLFVAGGVMGVLFILMKSSYFAFLNAGGSSIILTATIACFSLAVALLTLLPIVVTVNDWVKENINYIMFPAIGLIILMVGTVIFRQIALNIVKTKEDIKDIKED